MASTKRVELTFGSIWQDWGLQSMCTPEASRSLQQAYLFSGPQAWEFVILMGCCDLLLIIWIITQNQGISQHFAASLLLVGWPVIFCVTLWAWDQDNDAHRLSAFPL